MLSNNNFVPGQEFVLVEDESVKMVLIGRFSGDLWFNNGLYYPESCECIKPTGQVFESFPVCRNIWTVFQKAGLIGNLTENKPGDIVLVFSSDHLEVVLDTIMTKDSPRQLIISAKGRVMSFVGGLYLWTGMSVDLDTMVRTPEALSLLHQLYG